MARPPFESITSGEEFNRWYWLKEEMVNICKTVGLPANGRKFELRDRIMYALDHNGAVLKCPTQSRKSSRFNWARDTLTVDTIITDNVSFGPNFRRFMTAEIGPRFVCHSDFMDWVKSNTGKTLRDAIQSWHDLEARKEDPNFKRDIADNNMYAQYTRDYIADNPGSTIKEARKFWLMKKVLPTADGFVRYDASDNELS